LRFKHLSIVRAPVYRRFGDDVRVGDVVGDGFEGVIGTGEIISLRSIRPKAVVDAEPHRLDVCLTLTPGTTSEIPAIVPGNDRLAVLKL
jgi:hypothetical protein